MSKSRKVKIINPWHRYFGRIGKVEEFRKDCFLSYGVRINKFLVWLHKGEVKEVRGAA